MDLISASKFFMWCTIINGSVLGLWSLSWLLIPDVVYKLQSRLFSVSREHFELIFYCFIGAFKIFFIMLNLVPYIAFLIISET